MRNLSQEKIAQFISLVFAAAIVAAVIILKQILQV